jgi:hypothetical protein
MLLLTSMSLMDEVDATLTTIVNDTVFVCDVVVVVVVYAVVIVVVRTLVFVLVAVDVADGAVV